MSSAIFKHSIPLAVAATLILGAGSPAFADDDPGKAAIKYRQSIWSLVGANMKPMGGMMKGKIDWDGKRFASMAADMNALASLDHLRGYPEDSDEGKTKAKPEIWLNMDDFKSKLADFTKAAADLDKAAAAGGDKGSVKKQFGALGKSCKSCHKEYRLKKD